MAHQIYNRQQRFTQETGSSVKKATTEFTPKFVEYIPVDGEQLVDGTMYISMKHKMVVHRCPCGCGGLSEFMLDPIRFRLEYDGERVTFHPSIGNSNLQCRSHYWIIGNRVRWCAPMTDSATHEAERRERATALEARAAQRGGLKRILDVLQRAVAKHKRS